jgi:ABC-type phosphate transport system permease subunit
VESLWSKQHVSALHFYSCVLTLLPVSSFSILTQRGCRNLRFPKINFIVMFTIHLTCAFFPSFLEPKLATYFLFPCAYNISQQLSVASPIYLPQYHVKNTYKNFLSLFFYFLVSSPLSKSIFPLKTLENI